MSTVFSKVLSQVVLFACIVTNTASAAEHALEINGSFSLKRPSGEETPWTHFRVLTDGSQYQISNHYFNGEILMSGSAGTNSYFLHKMTSMGSNRWEQARVSAGSFPIKDASAGQLCWLAFASSLLSTNRPAKLPLEAFQQNGNYFHYDAKFSPEGSSFLSSIEWYGTNFWYLNEENLENKVSLPYTNGFLAAEYIVSSKTNFDSLEIPISFELSTFIPSFMGYHTQMFGMKEITLSSTLKAQVTSINVVEKPADFRPPLSSRVQVSDFRIPLLPDKSYVMITRVNSKWPEPDDDDFKRALSISAASQAQSSTKHSSNRKVIRTFLLVSVISSFAILLAITRKSRTTSNKHHEKK